MSPNMQRASAIALLMLMLLMCWMVIFDPLLSFWQDRRDRVEQSAHILTSYRRATANTVSLEDKVQSLSKENGRQGGFQTGASAALVAAGLQTSVKQIIQSQAGEVTSSQILPPTIESGFEKVAIRVNFKVSASSLPKVIYSIETALPSLFIENVQIHGMQTPPQPGATDELTQFLSVEWDVYGYSRNGAP